LDNPAVHARPTGFSAAATATTTRACFFLGAVRLTAFRPTFFLGHLDDLAVHAAPYGLPFAMRARFFLGVVALIAFHSGLGLWDLDNFSVDAAPPISSSGSWTIPPRFLFGAKALTARLTAFVWLLYVKDLVVRAAPTAAFCFTSRSRFLFGSVPMTASLIAIRLGHRDDVHAGGCVNAAPTQTSVAASFARSVFGTVALTAPLLAVLFGRLEGGRFERSFDAAPTLLVTSGSRFGFGSVPMTASLVAIRPGHRDDVHAGGCVNAAPTQTSVAASFARSVFGTVTLAVAPFAVFLGDINHFTSVASRHAAPAHSTMRRCLFCWAVTLQLSFFGVRLGNPNGFSVYANPAVSSYAIVFPRFFLWAKTPTTSPLAILFSHLNELFACGSLDATPTQLAIRVRFLWWSKPFTALSLTFFSCAWEDFSVETAPTRRTIILGRFFLGVETPTAFGFAISLGSLNELFSFPSLEAAPTRLTMGIRLVVGFVTFAISAPAFYFADPNDLAVDAAPTTFAILGRLFWVIEALTTATLAFLLAYLDKFFAVNAAPTRFAVCARFLRWIVALTTAALALPPRGLEYFSFNAAPTRDAIPLSLSRRVVTLATFGLAVRPSGLDDDLLTVWSDNAAPTRFAVPVRLFRRRVTLTTLLLTFGRRAQIDVAVNTAVAPIGRTWWRLAAAVVRTRQWPPKTSRRIGRTGWMTSGTAVPLVTAAITLPPAAASLLLPNPLTTRVTPPSAIDWRRRHQESMLISIESHAFADNLQAIINRLGDSQHFEIARR
jgi:hypothetical protein